VARILIVGCGYVGAATADLFSAAGWEVEGWIHSAGSAERLAAKPYRIKRMDVADRRQVTTYPVEFDVVIHCASTRGGDPDLYRSVYLAGVRHLVERFSEARLLFTSSTSVYAQKAGELVTEETVAQPEHETGKILREAEETVLRQGGMVARLAGIYGPGRSALLRKVVSGEAVHDAANDRFVNQAHRDDIAAALFRLVNAEGASPGIYNVVDDKPMRQSECYGWLIQKMERPPVVGGTPSASRKRGVSNKRVSNAKLRALGWQPRYPSMIEGMEQSILPNR
jgi:nucleoside-diphosphate-sugar epimerase